MEIVPTVGVNDLVLLPKLSEQSILENLKLRHAADIIYCYIGHVLVVVNPYKWLDIYGESTMRQYAHKARIDVPPHVFATAEEAYRTMLSEEDNQCVIISGESGAGKTEASKQIQNYIAAVSGSGAGVDRVKRTFLESNPLLEAFGNAKTLRNNNSSRFGKYFEMLFDSAGRPQGGQVSNYLLEKSRVVRPSRGERNFHIFYQILAGLPSSVRTKWHLDKTKPKDFAYLASSGSYHVDGVDDASEFTETMQAMQHVGVKKKQIELVFQALAGILHLGNVQFEDESKGDSEGCRLQHRESLDIACELLGLDADRLEHSLCFKLLQTMAPGGTIESYEVPQNPSQAAAQRDSIAKNIYDRLFDFLVARVNKALDIEKQAERHGHSVRSEDLTSVGILDIYGFEIFDQNGFEQFCINYVNEKLQQIFIRLTLESEQDEYKREGIAWTPIPFFNNAVVCDLIEAKKPAPGLFLILDDTSKTMHSRQGDAVDASFLEKAASIHQQHAHFSKRGKTFTIQHYAGDVSYSIEGFGDANRDFLSKDIAVIIGDSSNKLLKYIFPEEVDLNDRRLPQTAALKIRTQCQVLVDKLLDCTPHYVRTLKSNDQKQPNRIDDKRVQHQIKYLGLLENVKVRRAGYAYRGDYGRFVDRFRLLSRATYPEFKGTDKKGAQAILKAASKELSHLESETQFGQTMVFIQTPETFFALEKLREKKVASFVERIQRAWKKYSGRRHLLQLSHDITKLYANSSKQRQRVSIYRPFDSDYVLGEDVRAEVMKILEHHQDKKKIRFLDVVDKVVSVSTEVEVEKRVLLISDTHVYLMEQRTWEVETDPKRAWAPPMVYLRRRLSLDQIEQVVMSTHADPYLILRVKQSPPLTQPDKSHWMDDKQTLVCMSTGKKFGLFNRRHHCRYSGKIYCHEVCKHLEYVPDRGFYTPSRVFEETIGFFSTEMPEDQLLSSEKKTEIAVTLVDALRSLNQSRLSIEFQNKVQLRVAPKEELRRSPSQAIEFQRGQAAGISGTTSKVVVTCEDGVPEEYLRKRRKREKARRKKMEKQKEEEMALRAQRQAERDKQREKERLKRVAEKKAKKQAEREARKAGGRKAGKSGMEHARKFGENLHAGEKKETMVGGANSELAAALAKRRG